MNLQQQNLVQILLRVVYYSTCFILEYIFSLLGPTLDTRIKVMLVTMNLLKQCSSLPMFLIIVMVNCSVAFQSRLHEATAQNRAVAPTVLARIPYFQKQQKQQEEQQLSSPAVAAAVSLLEEKLEEVSQKNDKKLKEHEKNIKALLLAQNVANRFMLLTQQEEAKKSIYTTVAEIKSMVQSILSLMMFIKHSIKL